MARIRARFRGPIGIDDLSSVTRPWLDERARKRLPGRYDISAQRIWKIYFGILGESRQQHRRAKEYRDLSFAQDRYQIRPGPNLLLRQHYYRAARHPGTVHFRDTSVVTERRNERGRIHPGNKIEIIGVAQRKIHITGVRTFDTSWGPGRSTGVKDGRKALGWIVQPRWRFKARRCCRQLQDIERWQIAKFVLPSR